MARLKASEGRAPRPRYTDHAGEPMEVYRGEDVRWECDHAIVTIDPQGTPVVYHYVRNRPAERDVVWALADSWDCVRVVEPSGDQEEDALRRMELSGLRLLGDSSREDTDETETWAKLGALAAHANVERGLKPVEGRPATPSPWWQEQVRKDAERRGYVA